MTREQQSKCVFCSRQAPVDNIVFEDDQWLVRHSAETNILGYFVIEAKRHFVDLSQSTDREARSYGEILRALQKAIREVTHCQRVYTFSLGEAVEHFHLHVIPRTEKVPRTFRGRGILAYPTQPGPDAALAAHTSERVARRMERTLPAPVS